MTTAPADVGDCVSTLRPEAAISKGMTELDVRPRDRRGRDPAVGSFTLLAMALMAALFAAILAVGEAGLPLHQQLVAAGSRAFQTSLSTLWRGSDDLRFKTTYAGGTVLDGFICSDLIDIGGYSSLAPFGCITETSGVLDGAGIAGFGVYLFWCI